MVFSGSGIGSACSPHKVGLCLGLRGLSSIVSFGVSRVRLFFWSCFLRASLSRAKHVRRFCSVVLVFGVSALELSSFRVVWFMEVVGGVGALFVCALAGASRVCSLF